MLVALAAAAGARLIPVSGRYRAWGHIRRAKILRLAPSDVGAAVKSNRYALLAEASEPDVYFHEDDRPILKTRMDGPQ